MIYRNGYDFEDAIFNRHSSGESLVNRFLGQRPNFDKDVKKLIREGSGRYPKTPIGEALFLQTEKELKGLGIDTTGFVFLSAIDTKVDLRHFADGVFYLPSIHKFPITVDAFKIDQETLFSLKDSWVDGFEGNVYTNLHFQSDLFRYKVGFMKWKRECEISLKNDLPIPPWPTDFREYTRYGRPENHFILTPSQIGNYRQRRKFVGMLVEYFASKAVTVKPCPKNTAKQSH